MKTRLGSIALLFLCLFSLVAAAQQSLKPRIIITPNGKAPLKPGSLTLPCFNKCNGDVSLIKKRDEKGRCVVKMKIPCAPYGCENKTGMCRSSCTHDTICSGGAICRKDQKRCVFVNYRCIGDRVRRSDNKYETCTPYQCKAGTCMQKCALATDCSRGFVCDREKEKCIRM